jgi:predicted  nucleic acid-binding Zn-ribbon protein
MSPLARIILICSIFKFGLADEPPKGAYVQKLKKLNPYDIKGDDIDKGGEVSKACRYDEAEWSDCDPFELIRFRTLRLVAGGRQCEEIKNITKHCTADELPPGTKWLIAEHRKCIAELKRLKIIIADMSKYINALREKGRELFNSYLALKKHLEELKYTIDKLERENDQKKEVIAKVKEEMENWKGKARELQTQLDELKTKYRDLEAEHKEMAQKQTQCDTDVENCHKEVGNLKTKIHDLELEQSDLKRRLNKAQRYKETLQDAKIKQTKLEFTLEKLGDKLEFVKDELDTCKIDLLGAKQVQDNHSYKDTHLDLGMEMWITHNRSNVEYSTVKYSVSPEYYKPVAKKMSKCLISYYGITNETCWYPSKIESAEADVQDTLGEHLVEAHWKYFTIEVRDQYECDDAAYMHYEFLIQRCQPKHYLPVLSIFRPSENSTELDTHIYPKPNIPQPGEYNRCWITFMGPHGHCERRMKKYPLYNSDDTPHGYKDGSGTSKSKCLSRAKIWSDYCENPAIATYIPEGKSSNWNDEDVQHDNHGGRMFEERMHLKDKINPNSLNPHNVSKPDLEGSVEYEDTPEFRQSLNMEGVAKEAILKKLRDRLGMKEKKKDVKPGSNSKVDWHGDEGEHGTHNGPKKADAYVTLKPGMSADNLSHKGGHAKGGYAKGY